MGEKITLSVIKADVGGFVGHSTVHPELSREGQPGAGGENDTLIDFFVGTVGDDINLIMTHKKWAWTVRKFTGWPGTLFLHALRWLNS
jgi:fructose 1,6-bisphosphate aldolase/phosphatase